MRSVTSRNYLGGFLGGVFGIFAFAHFGPLSMIVACLVGVIGGWWYEEIGAAISSSALCFFKPREKSRDELLCIYGLANLTFLGINGLFMYSVPTLLGDPAKSTASVAALFGVLLTAWTVGIIITFFKFVYQGRWSWRKSWRYYRRHSVMQYFFYEMRQAVREIGTSVLVIMHFLCLLCIFFTVVIPFAVFMGLLKGIQIALTQNGHVLCLLSTTTVTVVCAFSTAHLLSDVRMQWLVALAVGLASGVVTEGVRLLMYRWIGQRLSNALERMTRYFEESWGQALSYFLTAYSRKICSWM